MKPHPVAIIVSNTFSIEIGTLLRVFRTTQAISEHIVKIMELEAIYENVQDKNRTQLDLRHSLRTESNLKTGVSGRS